MAIANHPTDTPARTPDEGLIRLTHVMYALHAFSAVTGIISSAFIVTAFLTGWPSIIAIIINYVKRSDTRGTWLDSHFSWQLRTFWFALGWVVAGVAAFITFIGIPVAFLIWVGTGLWVLYRLIRGWINLSQRKGIGDVL